MAFVHGALQQSEVGPGAWRVVGPEAPAPMRQMAARGMVPLPPRDILVALYQIWVANDPDVSAVAATTVTNLPIAVLTGALADPSLPAGVLDFLGRKLPRNQEVLERVVQHRNADNETLAGVARTCPEAVCDVLADNQERWLRFPAIVESLYQNPNCRMSVVHRMLELAVREGIDVRLPNMEEIRQALLEGEAAEPARDEAFKQAAGAGVQQSLERVIERVAAAGVGELDDVEVPLAGEALPEGLEAFLAGSAVEDLSLPMDDASAEAPPDGAAAAELAVTPESEKGRVLLIARLKPMEKIRLALLGNTFERFVLIRDSNKAVAMSAIKSPRVNENEVVAYAANRTLTRDVISYIARRREWTKLYLVQVNLVLNPKTPMALAMGFLSRLHPHDVRKVAFSKNIPSALAIAARRRLDQRG